MVFGLSNRLYTGDAGGGGGTPQGLYNIYLIKLFIVYKTIKP
jgi:hypothetical protein